MMWFAWIFGFGGIHRFYLGKPVTGVIYLLTWGLVGVGQIMDLMNMDLLVGQANDRARRLYGGRSAGALGGEKVPVKALPPKDPEEAMRMTLLHAAKKHGGKLTVTQGVMASGKSFKEVEKALDDMAKSGYVDIDNDAGTGAVVYVFGELSD
jgi:hypothetical protein